MPFLEDGTRAEQVVNILGVGNRLNPKQLYEIELNYQKHEIIKMMQNENNFDEKVNIFFRFIYLVSLHYHVEFDEATGKLNVTRVERENSFYDRMKSFYDSLSKSGKISFIEDIENNGFSIEQDPMDNINLEGLSAIYQEFNIKPQQAYVNKWGRKIPIMGDTIIADKYIYRLKHHKIICVVYKLF